MNFSYVEAESINKFCDIVCYQNFHDTASTKLQVLTWYVKYHELIEK